MTQSPAGPAITATALTKRFGSFTAVDRISFEVGAGEVFGFLGANGAGKTTTLRIVLGVLEADRGEVLFRGAKVDFSTRTRFGYMPEERGLYPKMRVRDQLVYLARLLGVPERNAGASADRRIERLA